MMFVRLDGCDALLLIFGMHIFRNVMFVLNGESERFLECRGCILIVYCVVLDGFIVCRACSFLTTVMWFVGIPACFRVRCLIGYIVVR